MVGNHNRFDNSIRFCIGLDLQVGDVFDDSVDLLNGVDISVNRFSDQLLHDHFDIIRRDSGKPCRGKISNADGWSIATLINRNGFISRSLIEIDIGDSDPVAGIIRNLNANIGVIINIRA